MFNFAHSRLQHRLGRGGQAAITLTIQSHVFSKWLRQQDVVTIFNKRSNRTGIAVNVAAGKSLVSHVEKRQKLSLQANRGNFLPVLGLREEKRKPPCLKVAHNPTVYLGISYYLHFTFGSTPVGLWAQAWSIMMDLSGICCEMNVTGCKPRQQVTSYNFKTMA